MLVDKPFDFLGELVPHLLYGLVALSLVGLREQRDCFREEYLDGVAPPAQVERRTAEAMHVDD